MDARPPQNPNHLLFLRMSPGSLYLISIWRQRCHFCSAKFHTTLRVVILLTSLSKISPHSPFFATSVSLPRKCFSSNVIRSGALQAGCQVPIGTLPRKQEVGVEKWIFWWWEQSAHCSHSEILFVAEISMSWERQRFPLIFTLLQGCILHRVGLWRSLFILDLFGYLKAAVGYDPSLCLLQLLGHLDSPKGASVHFLFLVGWRYSSVSYKPVDFVL